MILRILQPIFTQLAMLFNSNSQPLSKASRSLKELLAEKLIEWDWHKRQKIWRLTKKGLILMQTERMKYEHVDHTLAVGDIYFTLRPSKWMFEPTETFEHRKRSKPYVWAPDFIMVYGRKVYCGEVQLKSLSRKEWVDKWSIYNLFFESAYTNAEYQDWSSKSVAILPQFLVITPQRYATEGFNVQQRDLIVAKSVTEFF